MKIALILMAFAALSVGSILLAFTPVASRANLNVRRSIGSDTRTIVYTRLLSTSFIEDTSVWLVPLHGRNLLYTNDRGQRWHTVPSEAVNGFWQVSFIDRLQGWAIGSGGGVWKTSDGGEQWMPLTKLELHSDNGFVGKQLQFIDESNGWAIEAPEYLWKTADGGKSWKTYSPSNDLKADIVRLFFNSTHVGWLGCDKGILLRTNDGGESWESSKAKGTETFYDLGFTNDKAGWALIGNSVYHSLDGGQTWEPVLRNEEAFESPIILSLYFLNEQSGWVVGHSNAWAGKVTDPSEIKGVIFHTNDGGKTWIEIKTNIQDKVFSQIHFADQKHGWLISPDNVYRTTDGGQSWKAVLRIPTLQR